MTATLASEARHLEESFDQVLSSALPRAALLDAQRADSAAGIDARPIDAFGLASINVPADAGGLGFSRPTVAGLFEVAGRRLLPLAASQESVILAPLLAGAASDGDEQAGVWLRGLTDGRIRGGGGVAFGDAAAVARVEGAEIHLAGAPVWLAPGAAVAHVVTGSVAVLVDLAEPHLSVEPVHSVDAGQGLVRLSGRLPLRHARAITGARVDVLLRDWQLAVFAQLLGCGGELLDLSRAYAMERRQFGRPIAQHQAIAHRLADMAAAVETLRSGVSRVAWDAEHGDATAGMCASLRHWAPAAMRQVAEGAIQVHGGVGFTWESGLHLYYRRIILFQAALGGAAVTARDLGRALLQRVGEDA